MAATRFGLYNDALDLIGERRLAAVDEAIAPRRHLDSAWDKAGVTAGGPIYCLELGLWNFASRSSAFEYSPSVEPSVGFSRAFDKPVDWVRTAAVCSDPYFLNPLADTGYADESGFWFAHLDVIYVKYISKDDAYGLDLSTWPMSFCDFVATYLAAQVCMSITQNANKADRAEKAWQDALKKAVGIDGMNKPTATRATGSWAAARMGGSLGRER